ncbi:EamA family transporter, partial [Klebsiella pneumoniae]
AGGPRGPPAPKPAQRPPANPPPPPTPPPARGGGAPPPPPAGASTAANFVLATPMALALSLLFMKQGHYDAAGIALSLLSGAAASAGAYVLWYTLLPSLGSITASTLQLSVPCLAMLGGVVFLDESLTVRTIFSALAVLTSIVMVTREKSPRQSMTKAREP